MPRNLADVVVFPDAAKAAFCAWLAARAAGDVQVPALCLLVGGSGSGKATLVRSACGNLGVECLQPPGVDSLTALDGVLKGSCGVGRVADRRPSGPRLWLFTGVDGYTPPRREDPDRGGGEQPTAAAASFRDMLQFLAQPRPWVFPPVVFTLHDFGRPDLRELRDGACECIRVYPARPTVHAEMARVEAALQRVASANRMPEPAMLARVAAATYNGSLTHCLLVLSLAASTQSPPPSRALVAGDVQWGNPFEAARALLRTWPPQPGSAASAFDRSDSGTLTLALWQGYTEPGGDLEAAARAAAAWSQSDLWTARWDQPAVQEVGREYLVGALAAAHRARRRGGGPLTAARRPATGSAWDRRAGGAALACDLLDLFPDRPRFRTRVEAADEAAAWVTVYEEEQGGVTRRQSALPSTVARLRTTACEWANRWPDLGEASGWAPPVPPPPNAAGTPAGQSTGRPAW